MFNRLWKSSYTVQYLQATININSKQEFKQEKKKNVECQFKNKLQQGVSFRTIDRYVLISTHDSVK